MVLLARVPGTPWTSYFLLQKNKQTNKNPLIIPNMRRAEEHRAATWKDLSSVAPGMSKQKFRSPGCLGKEC